MANRRSSVLLQAGSAIALISTWLLAHMLRKKQPRRSSSQYNINAKAYGVLSAAFLLADLYAIPAVLRGKLDLDEDELRSIDHGIVPRIDRYALSFVGEHRERYRHISDHVLQGLVAIPFLLLSDPRVRRDWRSLAVLYSWVHALAYTIYSFSPLGPAFVDKYRPVVYYTDLPEAVRNLGNNRNARFSGHTANGAAAAFFLAKVYNDYHPQSTAPERGLRYLLAFGAALTLGWLRMRSLKHFPSDILQAIVIGGACGIMIPELYRSDESAEDFPAIFDRIQRK